MHDRIAGIAGRVENLEIGPAQPRGIDELTPVHAPGQSDIGEQELYFRPPLQHLERRFPVWRLEDLIAQFAQSRGCMGADVIIVLHDQDRFIFAPARNPDRRLLRRRLLVGIQARQINSDRRPLSHFAVNPHMAAGLLYEAIHLAQAETGAMSRVLRREERIEGSRERLRPHANTGVGDSDRDVLTGHDFNLPGGVALVEHRIGCFYGEPSAIRHGVPRIHSKVENRDFQLIGIDARPPEPPGENDFNSDLLADRAPQEIGHFGDQAIDLDGLGIERLLARESEKALRQEYGALSAAHGVVSQPLQIAAFRGRCLQSALEVFEIADNYGQQIIEIVRDAARQVADAFHLLRLPQSLLGLRAAR